MSTSSIVSSTAVDDSAGRGHAAWRELGLCAQTDPDAFYPEHGGSATEAKRICAGCEVRDRCLADALARDERFGIWGGLSGYERRRLRAARRIPA